MRSMASSHPATSWAQGGTRWRGDDPHRCALAGLSLHDHEADGRERDGTAGMTQTAVTDWHTAIGQDMREASAETRDGVEMGRPWAGTAHVPGGAGDRAVRARDETAVGDGDCADSGGEGDAGGVAVVMGLPVDVPGESPGLWGAVLAQSGLVDGFCEERTGERGMSSEG